MNSRLGEENKSFRGKVHICFSHCRTSQQVEKHEGKPRHSDVYFVISLSSNTFIKMECSFVHMFCRYCIIRHKHSVDYHCLDLKTVNSVWFVG